MVQLTESAGWCVDDDDSHGVKISIARGVVEMVRAHPHPLGPVFFSFFFILCIRC